MWLLMTITDVGYGEYGERVCKYVQPLIEVVAFRSNQVAEKIGLGIVVEKMF